LLRPGVRDVRGLEPSDQLAGCPLVRQSRTGGRWTAR